MIHTSLSPNNEVMKRIYKNKNTQNFMDYLNINNENTNKLKKKFYNLFKKLTKNKFKTTNIFQNIRNYTNQIMNKELQTIEQKYKKRIGNLKYQIIQIKKIIAQSEYTTSPSIDSTNALVLIPYQIIITSSSNPPLHFHLYKQFFIQDPLLKIFYQKIQLFDFINDINNQKFINKKKIHSILQSLNNEFKYQHKILSELKKNCKKKYNQYYDLIIDIFLNKIFLNYLDDKIIIITKNLKSNKTNSSTQQIFEKTKSIFLMNINNFSSIKLFDIDHVKLWFTENNITNTHSIILPRSVNPFSLNANYQISDLQYLNQQLNQLQNQITTKYSQLDYIYYKTKYHFLHQDYLHFFYFHLNYWNHIGIKQFQNIDNYLLFLENLWLNNPLNSNTNNN